MKEHSQAGQKLHYIERCTPMLMFTAYWCIGLLGFYVKSTLKVTTSTGVNLVVGVMKMGNIEPATPAF